MTQLLACKMHGDVFCIHGVPSVHEFSASRHFFKTNVAQSVDELILYSQKTQNVAILYEIW